MFMQRVLVGIFGWEKRSGKKIVLFLPTPAFHGSSFGSGDGNLGGVGS